MITDIRLRSELLTVIRRKINHMGIFIEVWNIYENQYIMISNNIVHYSWPVFLLFLVILAIKLRQREKLKNKP